MKPEQKWKDGTPSILVRVQGLGQEISKFVVYLRRPGAPPVKPSVEVYGEYEENPLYNHLFDMTRRVTDAMSESGWKDDPYANNDKLETTFLGFTTQLQKIRKQKGEDIAGKMLDAAIDKIKNTDFMRSLPNRELIIPQWEDTLRLRFSEAMHPPRSPLKNIRPS